MTKTSNQQPEAKFWGRRQGRPLTDRRQSALDEGMKRYGIDVKESDGLISPENLFNQEIQTIAFEIGFGAGEHMFGRLEQDQTLGMIGCEPFVNSLSMCCAEALKGDQERLRLYGDDARLLLKRLEPETIDQIYLLFPDPWPKPRHWSRRFLQPETLDMMARVLKPEGKLLMATDHPDLADWMLGHLLDHKRFVWTAETRNDWRNDPEGWIRTRYQEKAKAGTDNWFIEAKRV